MKVRGVSSTILCFFKKKKKFTSRIINNHQFSKGAQSTIHCEWGESEKGGGGEEMENNRSPPPQKLLLPPWVRKI